MAYGHAERNLAAIRQLEAETRELLSGLPQLDLEQLQWLQETADGGPEPAMALGLFRLATNGPGLRL
jgi:hypothetical protein